MKRLLLEFYELAEREISLLQQSDYHSNIIRYYCKETHGNFLYIALELCTASLHDLLELPPDSESDNFEFESSGFLEK